MAGAVEVVQPDEAAQMITQFLGGPFGTITTPPLDAYGNQLTLPVTTTTVPPATVASATTQAPSGNSSAATGSTGSSATGNPSIPPYDPRPC